MEISWSSDNKRKPRPGERIFRSMPPLGEIRPGEGGSPAFRREPFPSPFDRLLCDGRWRGPHGIGRFATEVLRRLPGARIIENGERIFLSPLDPFWIASRIAREKPFAYFTPGFNPPLPSMVPLVLTIHDLIHLKVPGEGGRFKSLYYEHIVKPALRSSFRVLTVSRFSKNEILEWAKIPEERVIVVGNGVSPDFSPTGTIYQLGFPYFLYVGNRKPHKNLPLLFDALSRARLPKEFRLLLSGSPDPETEREIRRWGIGERVSYAGTVAEKDLPSVYRGASALLFPSRLEGFGFPVLEAMACGLTVLASGIPAVEEVAEGTVRTFSPDDPDAWASAMEQVAHGDLSGEAVRKSKALERARLFSWEAVGGRVRMVLLEAMEASSS